VEPYSHHPAAERRSMTYLTRAPGAGEVPPGLVAVHNSVRPAQRTGTRGFRAWVERPHDRLEPCDCGWAPDLDVHYRVRRA
jgi:hypothetical protein